MDSIIVYFDSSPDLKSLLQQRGISLEGIASQVNIEAEVTFGSPTILDEESHSKDVVTIIVATSAGLSVLLLSLSNLLDTYFHRPHFYEWDELEEVREKGKVVKDNYGNPTWRVKRKHRVVYPNQLDRSKSIEFDAGIQGIVLRVTSEEEKTANEE